MTNDNSQRVADEKENFDASTVRSFKCGNFTVEGFSRGPILTYWRLLEYKIGFDLGWEPWSFTSVTRYFISHAHLDHSIGIPGSIARRGLLKLPNPTFYVPQEKAEDLRVALDAVGNFSHCRLDCEIFGLAPGDEIPIAMNLYVKAYKTRHTYKKRFDVPSLGYILWEKRSKLKDEFVGVPGEKLRELRASGIELTEEAPHPLFAYLGDSAPQGLDDNPDMFRADCLVAEMTQLVKREDHPTMLNGHMGVYDYAARQDAFQNKLIIAAHFSMRLSGQEIESVVDEVLPGRLDGRLKLVY